MLRHALFVLLAASSASVQSVPITFSASGANTAAIQSTVDSFRTALGTLNANVAGSFASGRREVNWDGLPDMFSAPNNLPANFFNVNSPRGVVFSTPGAGFQVSANAEIAPIEFGNIDPSYPALFAFFSPQRLFTSLGSNITDINFFVPGTTTPALTRGFGAVFSDVDIASMTSIQLFGVNHSLLGSFDVPNIAGSQTFSFIGISYSTPLISAVRILTGNTPLAAGVNDENGQIADVVAMDDFLYGEPVAVPEPSIVAMLIVGGGLLLRAVRKRKAA